MSHDNDEAERCSIGTTDSRDVHKSIPFVSPKEVQAESSRYADDPDAAKDWLVGFGHHKSGTEVSWSFLLTRHNHPKDKPHSMLPMLAGWLKTWFVRSVKGDAQQRKLLAWLLEYTADYIELGHDHLDRPEIIDLCNVLLHIVKQATVLRHIQNCMTIFQAIAAMHYFPPTILAPTLETMCFTSIVLDEPIESVTLCVRDLASGTLSKETVSALYGRVESVSNHAHANSNDAAYIVPDKFLTPARGALVHLANLVEVCGIDEKYVLRLPKLLEVINLAAQVHSLRLCTGILDLISDLLGSERAQEIRTTPELFASLVETIAHCSQAKYVAPPPDKNESLELKQDKSNEDLAKREARYKNDQEVASLRVKSAFVQILPKMGRTNHSTVWQYVGSSLSQLQAKKRQPAIDYARAQEICMPGRVGWSDQLSLLTEQVVLNGDPIDVRTLPSNTLAVEPIHEKKPDLRTDQRIDILDLCMDSIEVAAENKPEYAVGATSSLEIAQTALKRLLSLYPNEKYWRVRRAFLKAMRRLCLVKDTSGNPAFADLVVAALKDTTVRTSYKSDTPEDALVAGTRILREIFLQSLKEKTATAQKAFEALLAVARDCNSTRSRLTALSILVRIRCNDQAGVCIDSTGESVMIASALCKTESSLSIIYSLSANDAASTSSESSQKLKSVLDKQMWVYPREQQEVESWPIPTTSAVFIYDGTSTDHTNKLQMSLWLELVIEILNAANDWEVYSYVIVHLASQLLNMKVFEKSYPAVVTLRKIICERLIAERIMDPPGDMGLKKSDVALCLYHILSRLIPYARLVSPDIQLEGFSTDLVRAFVYGVDSMSEGSSKGYVGTARSCIHALSLCCFETPIAMSHQYYKIIDALSRSMSQAHLVVHILEFLAQLARSPGQHDNFTKDDIRRIFAMCIQFLEKGRSARVPASSLRARASTPVRHSGSTLKQPPYRAAMMQERGLPQYSMALAYHTMFFWFLSLDITERAPYISFIIPRLIWRTPDGKEEMDEQSRVFVDMMQRSAYSDLGITALDVNAEEFREQAGDGLQRSDYVVGHSIVTIELNTQTGKSLMTKRQASGTTYSLWRPLVQPRPAHFGHATRRVDEVNRTGSDLKAMPSHALLNMIGSAHPYPTQVQPFLLPKTDETARAIRSFDLVSDVDSHKIGIVALKNGQTSETEYLGNTTNTPSFEHFLDRIGTRMSLEPPVTAFKPLGLQYGTDGTETVAWRDRVNEIVFAVASMMPNAEEDTYYIAKKQHLGNCNVLIVFNQSNVDWDMSMFASQVTLCNIVVTPVNRASDPQTSDEIEHDFFYVEVSTQEEYQNISPAAQAKIISKDMLAEFVRMLALNANIFSAAAINANDTEFPSSWRSRYQMIKQVRENATKRQSANMDPAEVDSLAAQYDFSRWTC